MPPRCAYRRQRQVSADAEIHWVLDRAVGHEVIVVAPADADVAHGHLVVGKRAAVRGPRGPLGQAFAGQQSGRKRCRQRVGTWCHRKCLVSLDLRHILRCFVGLPLRGLGVLPRRGSCSFGGRCGLRPPLRGDPLRSSLRKRLLLLLDRSVIAPLQDADALGVDAPRIGRGRLAEGATRLHQSASQISPDLAGGARTLNAFVRCVRRLVTVQRGRHRLAMQLFGSCSRT